MAPFPQVEGIFRVAGSQGVEDDIRKTLNAGQPITHVTDVHSLASTVKVCFSDCKHVALCLAGCKPSCWWKLQKAMALQNATMTVLWKKHLCSSSYSQSSCLRTVCNHSLSPLIFPAYVLVLSPNPPPTKYGSMLQHQKARRPFQASKMHLRTADTPAILFPLLSLPLPCHSSA